MTYQLRAVAATDVGQRSNNEDSYLINEDLKFYIVADGMGGHSKGEVASLFASDELNRIVSEISLTEDDTIDDIAEHVSREDLLAQAVISINTKLFLKNEKTMNSKEVAGMPEILKKRQRMATTLVSLFVKGKKAYVVNLGDSRLYKYQQGELEQITEDHTWVNKQVKSGQLTPEQAVNHERSNVLVSCVGYKAEEKPDLHVLSLEAGERFLLCSDGLSNMLSQQDIKIFMKRDDLQKACKDMVALAKERGGRDNITAVIVDVGVDGEGECTLD